MAPSSFKKPRTTSPNRALKLLDKHGLPFKSRDRNNLGETKPSHDTIERSLRKDGEKKDLSAFVQLHE